MAVCDAAEIAAEVEIACADVGHHADFAVRVGCGAVRAGLRALRVHADLAQAAGITAHVEIRACTRSADTMHGEP